jgi:hypothetical protein
MVRVKVGPLLLFRVTWASRSLIPPILGLVLRGIFASELPPILTSLNPLHRQANYITLANSLRSSFSGHRGILLKSQIWKWSCESDSLADRNQTLATIECRLMRTILCFLLIFVMCKGGDEGVNFKSNIKHLLHSISIPERCGERKSSEILATSELNSGSPLIRICSFKLGAAVIFAFSHLQSIKVRMVASTFRE